MSRYHSADAVLFLVFGMVVFVTVLCGLFRGRA
jgi:hypothetical protein